MEALQTTIECKILINLAEIFDSMVVIIEENNELSTMTI